MKAFLMFVLAALMTACGPDYDPSPEFSRSQLGELRQPIYMPVGMGFERIGSQYCSPPWGGGDCLVPDVKVMLTGFRASTCSSWWQARFVEVWNEMEADLASINEWSLQTAPQVWYHWQCSGTTGTDVSNQLTWFAPNLGNGSTDDHDVVPWGELRQYHAGTLTAYTAQIEAMPQWAVASDLQRKKFARTALRRAAARQVGLGDDGSYLMASPYRLEWFNDQAFWTDGMLDTLECYSEDSGTGPDC